MKKISKIVATIKKTEYIFIPVSARCCTICGTHFDEEGICGNGHEKGKSYPKPR